MYIVSVNPIQARIIKKSNDIHPNFEYSRLGKLNNFINLQELHQTSAVIKTYTQQFFFVSNYREKAEGIGCDKKYICCTDQDKGNVRPNKIKKDNPKKETDRISKNNNFYKRIKLYCEEDGIKAVYSKDGNLRVSKRGVSWYRIDLNDDGKKEIIIDPGLLFCGSGGFTTLIYENHNNKIHKIGDFFGGGIQIQDKVTNGYNEIMIPYKDYLPEGGWKTSIEKYFWNKKEKRYDKCSEKRKIFKFLDTFFDWVKRYQ